MIFRNVFAALMISVSVAIAASVGARAEITQPPTFSPDNDTKGTIGLICVDQLGNTYTWYQGHNPTNIVESMQHEAFEGCVNSVVSDWANNNVSSLSNTNNSTSVDFNELLGGYSTYRNAVDSTLRNRR